MVKAAEHNRPLVSDGFTARKPVKPEVDDRRHDEHDENPTAADDQRHEQTKVMHRRDLHTTHATSTTPTLRNLLHAWSESLAVKSRFDKKWPSVLRRCWLGGRKGIRRVKTE